MTSNIMIIVVSLFFLHTEGYISDVQAEALLATLYKFGGTEEGIKKVKEVIDKVLNDNFKEKNQNEKQ